MPSETMPATDTGGPTAPDTLPPPVTEQAVVPEAPAATTKPAPLE
jgi:hypothetical protein